MSDPAEREVQLRQVGSEDDGARVDRWFKRHFPDLSYIQLEKLLRSGQVRVNGGRAKAGDRLSAGAEIRVPPLPAPRAAPDKPGAVPSRDRDALRDMIVYEDDRVVVLNKPPGLAVQGGTRTPRHVDGMLDALAINGQRPRLVHRLDRDTSGLLVIARDLAATTKLGEAFRSRDLLKVYWAVVIGAPKPLTGQVRCWLVKDAKGSDREKVRRGAQNEDGALHAISDYVTLSNAGGRAAWVALRPVTGRTHQLRVHMTELGTPILGDVKYTGDRPAPEGLPRKLHLHARALALPHPDGRLLRLTAPIPTHFKETFEALGFDEREARDAFEPFT